MGDEPVIVATRIQHHPSRAHLIPPLLARLDGLDPAVITDPDPGTRLPSSWRTHRACIETLPDDATHLLVIQDDAIVCDQFAARALQLLEERPTRVVSFFVPGLSHLARQVNIARKRREAWMDFVGLIPLVAVCYPADVARGIPDYADRRRMSVKRADDAVVATYAKAHRIMACAPLPNLVDHDGQVPLSDGDAAVGRSAPPLGVVRRYVAHVLTPPDGSSTLLRIRAEPRAVACNREP